MKRRTGATDALVLSARESRDRKRSTVNDRRPATKSMVVVANAERQKEAEEAKRPAFAKSKTAALAAFGAGAKNATSRGSFSLLDDPLNSISGISAAKKRGTIASVGGMSSLIVEGELAQTPVLKECLSDFTSHLAEEATGKVYGEGQVIRTQGEHGNTMCVVIRGKAVGSVGGVSVMELHKGDYIGESLMLGVCNTWSITLTSESASCMICEISQSLFYEALSKYPNEKEHFASPMGVSVMTDPGVGTLNDPCPIFGGIPEALMLEIEKNMVSRSLFPGQTILGRGAGSGTQDLVLLMKGTVNVELAGRCVRTEQKGELNSDLDLEVEVVDSDNNSPPCFGELEVLGLNEARKAEVIAVTPCQVRILHRLVLEEILATHVDLTQDAVMTKVPPTIPRQYEEGIHKLLQIFTDAGCSGDFLKFLGDNLEERLYVQGVTMVDFKAGSRSLHVLVAGTANAVDTNGESTPQLCQGTVFGGMKVLGVASRPEGVRSITAADQCRCQVLHQSVVVRALELFPDQRMKVLNIANQGKQELSDRANSKADFMNILSKSAFFCNTHPDFVEELGKAAIDRIFMPGDFIVFEGDIGYSMFILVNGSAEVFMQDPEKKSQETSKREKHRSIKSMTRVGHLAPGAIAGELAMLGITQTRSATIQAASLCVLWEVNQERAMAILDRFPEEQSLFSKVIVQNLDLSVPSRLLGLPLFKNFDRKFRMLLTLYCERHAFFPDHKVLREGENGDKLWILNTGPAMLQKKGHTVKIFSPGSHFGADHMLGINRSYCGTLVAMTVSHMLAVSRSSYLLALEQYPAKQASQELLRAQRVECQAIRENVERTAIRKGIWTRYQGDVQSASPGIRELSNDDLLKRIVKCWNECVKVLRSRRQQKEQGEADRQFMLENWRLKQEEARKKLEPKKRLQALIESNIANRGPLKVFDLDDTPSKDSNTAVPSQHHSAKTSPPAAGLGPETENFVSYLQSWPQPRRSPHYNLKVWGVVRDELLSQHQGQRKMKLLPLLSLGQKPEEKTRTTNIGFEEPAGDENSDDEYWTTKEEDAAGVPLPDLPPLKGNLQSRMSQRKTIEGRRSLFQSQAAMLKAMQQMQATDISETDGAHIRPATPDDIFGPPPY